jgi:hypothetical protein
MRAKIAGEGKPLVIVRYAGGTRLDRGFEPAFRLLKLRRCSSGGGRIAEFVTVLFVQIRHS